MKVKEAGAGILQKRVEYTQSENISPLYASFARPTLETFACN